MTFATPAAFWLLLASGPLLAMYFLKVRRRRFRVPTLLLWESVVENQRRARPWDRFRRHDLLWLQLLALLLLTLALAGPQVRGRTILGRSVVWIVDVSASMAAEAPAPSRIERAREAVLSEIGRLRPGDEGMILAAGAEPQVAASFTRDKDKLALAVRGLRASSSAAEIGGAIDLAVSLTRSRPDRTIVVVTDGSDRTLDAAVARHPSIRAVQVGLGAPNVAITALDLRRSPSVDLESELFVTLRRFGGEPGPVGLEVTLDGELLATESVEVPADRPVARVYRQTGERGGLLRVHVETGDALPADDDAVAWLRPPSRRRILCVGCSVLTARALAVDPRFDVVASGSWPAAGEDGNAAGPEALDPALPARQAAAGDTPGEESDGAGAGTVPAAVGWDLVVAEDTPVPATPSVPVLALGPSRLGDQEPWPEVSWPRVTQWRRNHPALRFVQPGNLHITRARPPLDSRWEPLLESDQGPLMTTSMLGGQRIVVLHFRPADSDLPLTVAWPLLLLNTAGWLTGEEARGTSQTLAAGSPLVREGWGEDGEELVLVRPDSTESHAPIRDGVARFGSLDQAGVYSLRGPGGRQERIAANLVSESESDLAVVATQEPPRAVDGAAVVSTSGRVSLVRPALLLVAIALLGEWLLWQRKYRDG